MHKAYRDSRLKKEPKAASSPSLAGWRELVENLKDSCRQQADHIAVKLDGTGCEIAIRSGDPV